MMRKACLSNVLKRIKIAGFVLAKSSYDVMTTEVMAGIVKILFSTVCTFSTLLKLAKYAHQNFIKLQHVENTALLSLGLELKILVSVVRFRPRPPRNIKTTCGWFLHLSRRINKHTKAIP